MTTKDLLDNTEPNIKAETLPEQVDLTPYFPAVYNQGKLNTSTVNAIAAVLEYDRIKQRSIVFTPSRLFIDYNARKKTRDIQTSGVQIIEAIKALETYGVCPEPLWTYSDNDAKLKQEPPAICYENALNYKSISYSQLDGSVEQLKTCLAEGYPVVFSLSVYTAFASKTVAQTGILDLPDFDTEECLGNHIVVAVGYDDTAKKVIVRNSWGKDWGQKGYFTIPYDYFTVVDDQENSLVCDFWKITN
jgi:C1A family cysteine protease